MEMLDRLRAALGNRYRIDRLLGEGGMALVYLAEDVKHGRKVAIKVLRPEVSGAVATERFLREIEVAAGLNHPNVLALHDSGEADGLHYFVMPWVEGESLRDRLRREGRLSVDDALRIAGEVADALDYAHARGLVHRDIKPENVLFQAGHALVSDFGIAQVATGADERLTRTGISVGTLAYMSPEQLDDGAVDRRADIYALGCVVHEMLTGGHPFTGATPQAVLARKLTGERRAVVDSRDDVPGTIDPALARAMHVRPDARYDSAGDFVGKLRDAVSREGVLREERHRARRKWLRRGSGVTGLVALAAVSWAVSQAVTRPAMERIVVLPLENAQRDSSQQFFVEGAYADLVHELAGVVRVISLPSAIRVAEAGLSPREIAADLDVDGIVVGRASLDTERVTLTLELVDGVSEEIVWSRRFESPPRRILNLYRLVALAVADEMGLTVDEDVRARLAASPDVDPDVYQALLQARFQWQKLTPEGIDTAEDYYELALRLDSLSAEAWWGLSHVWGVRAQMGMATGEEALERGARYRARAEELDPELAARDGGVRAWLLWDFEAADESFRADLEQDPTNAVTRAYFSHLLLYRGEPDEAEAQITEAVEADPYNTRVQSLYGQYLNLTRRYEDAEAAFNRVLAREPNDPLALSNARTTYHHLGRYEEAMPIWRDYYGAAGDTAAVRALDDGYVRGGYPAALRAVAEEFVARQDQAKLWQIATLYTRAGDDGPALDYLERAAAVRDPNTPYITIDPLFDHLRDEARFQALVRTLYAPGG